MQSIRRNHLIRYFVFVYVLFWILLGLTGVLISLKVSLLVQQIMKNVCAWAPTFVIAVLFKKLFPNTTLRDYLKSNFLSKVSPMVFVLSLLVQAAVVCVAIAAYLVAMRLSISSLSVTGIATLPTLLLVNITSGPLGEELGWRGFALNELQKKYAPFTSSVILAVFWGFWHTPLWLISGYSGMNLLLYIAFFLIGIFSISILITAIYNRNKNIIVAMWIHFLFNFLLALPKIDTLPLWGYTSSAYAILAAVWCVFDRKAFVKPIGIDKAATALI